MKIHSVSFLFGMGSVFLSGNLPSIAVCLILTVFLTILSAYYRNITPFLSFSIGFLYAVFTVHQATSSRLPELFSGEIIQLIGTIDAPPKIQSHKTRFSLKIEHAEHQKTPLNIKRVTLNWYKTSPVLKQGMRLSLSAKLKSPHGRFNQSGFDYSRWLLVNRFDATGSVRGKSPYKILKNANNFGSNLAKFRQRTKDTYLKSAKQKPLLTALLLGDKSDITKEHWQVLQNTGTAHLIAISGLHLGLVAFGIMTLVRRLLARFGTPTIALNSLYISSVVGVLSAFFYAILAGFSVPTQRSFLMVALFTVLLTSSRTSNRFYVFLATLLFCLLIEPFLVLSAGFWLSFVAVFWLLLFASNAIRRSSTKVLGLFSLTRVSWLLGLIWIQWLLGLSLAPVLSSLGFGVSIISLPANLIAVPVISLIVLPFLLLGFIFSNTPIGVGFLWVSDTTLTYLWQFLSHFSELPNALIQFPQLTIWQTIFASIGVFILLMPRKFPLKIIGLLLFILPFFPIHSLPKFGTVKITTLDVGQGLSVLIETNRRTILYDTGANYYFSDSVFTQSVQPFLIQNGIRHFDKFIISHSDNDHAGGFDDVLQNFSVTDIIASEPDGLKNTRLCRPEKWRWDGVDFAILHPQTTDDFVKNNASCVLLITAHNHSMLLLSDIEKSAERALIRRYPELKPEVILVPHHGSKTSSTVAFLQSLAPKIGIISSGYKNSYNHPHPAIVKRLKKHGVQLFNTADSGVIEVLINDEIQITSYRQKFGRFWHKIGLD